jgi:hypothetical protein
VFLRIVLKFGLHLPVIFTITYTTVFLRIVLKFGLHLPVTFTITYFSLL